MKINLLMILSLFLCAIVAMTTLACFETDEEDDVLIYHATFNVDGVAKDYKTITCFQNAGSSTSGVYWRADEMATGSNDSISITLPNATYPGAWYDQYSPYLSFIVYYTNSSGKFYGVDWDESNDFDLRVTEWGNGMAKGTFSGKLISTSDFSLVTITNGTFEACK